jgi:hypothetical protein
MAFVGNGHWHVVFAVQGIPVHGGRQSELFFAIGSEVRRGTESIFLDNGLQGYFLVGQ